MNLLIYFASLLLQPTAYDPGGLKVSEPIVISGNQPGGSPFFTTDHLGNTVVCWTSGDKTTSQLYYAVYHKKTGVFGKTVTVTPSAGTPLHGESMNKVAFTKDGFVVAVYGRKHPTEKNKYAGSIYYVQSFDQGKTWSNEKYLHTDTIRAYGRSYFDIATLPDGEVGAVWLDGRHNLGSDGSSLYFAKTKNKKGFQPDQLLGETVCQCCRTDLYADQQGNVHLIYRDIESTLKGQVRDFVHLVSNNNGLTFSSAKKISNDNWILSGCPHTGASIAGDQNNIGIVWYTAGGTPGLYHTSTPCNEISFTPRKLISAQARHPQLALWKNQSAIVWEESAPTTNHTSHGDHRMHPSEGSNQIVLTLTDKGNTTTTRSIIDNEGEFPVLHPVSDNEVLVAYTKNNQVLIRKVNR